MNVSEEAGRISRPPIDKVAPPSWTGEVKKLKGWRLSVKVRPEADRQERSGRRAGRWLETCRRRSRGVRRDRQRLARAVSQHAAELRVASTLRDERENKALENRGDLSAGKALSTYSSKYGNV